MFILSIESLEQYLGLFYDKFKNIMNSPTASTGGVHKISAATMGGYPLFLVDERQDFLRSRWFY